MNPAIQVGFSCAPIMPPDGTPMAGFAARTLPSAAFTELARAI